MSLLLVYGLMFVNNDQGLEAEIIASKVNAFGDVRQLSILYESGTEVWVGQIAEKLEMPIMLNVRQKPSRMKRLLGYPNSMILVLDETLSADDVLDSTFREHSTVYVITLHSFDDVEPRLQKYWDHLVIHAFALVLNVTESQLYGFEPTPDGIQIVKREIIELIDIFNGHGLLVHTTVANLPPSVVLQKDPTEIEGYEGRIILEVTRKFNVSVRFAVARDGQMWGWLEPFPAGAMGEVFYEYSAYAIGDIALTASRMDLIDQLGGYSFMECLTWVVPKGAGAALPQWIAMLITEYALDAWLGIIISSICVIIACFIIDDSGFISILFRTFAVSIGAPVDLPIKASSRILITVWVWACFIIAVAYQASMGSKLAVPPVKPDINSFKDLLESDLYLTGVYNPLSLINMEDPVTRALKLRSSNATESISSLLERVAKKRDLAYFRQLRTFRYNGILDPSSLDNIHIMETCAVVYFPAICMTRWSPYYRGTRKIVQWLMESGLSTKWEKDLMPEIPTVSSPPTPLDLNQLFGVFALLFIGYAICAIALLIENIMGHLNFKSILRIIGFSNETKVIWLK